MIHTDRLIHRRVAFGPGADDIRVSKADLIRAIRDNLISRGCSAEFATACAAREAMQEEPK